MHTGRTDKYGRQWVSLDGASTRFEVCRDVSFGGVLCALPALAENGLFRHIHDCLSKLRGYYSTLHVIILLAYMALCRFKAVEQLQYQPPGELGKLLGLDHVARGPLSPAQARRPEYRRWPRKMGRAVVPRLAGGRARTGWCPLRRRTRSPLPRQSDRPAQTLCLATAFVPSGNDRLLGQRHFGPAVLRGRTAD